MNWLVPLFAYDYLMDVQKCTRKIVHCDWIATCLVAYTLEHFKRVATCFIYTVLTKLMVFVECREIEVYCATKKNIHYVNSTLEHSISMDCLYLASSLLVASSCLRHQLFGQLLTKIQDYFILKDKLFLLPSLFYLFLSR